MKKCLRYELKDIRIKIFGTINKEGKNANF